MTPLLFNKCSMLSWLFALLALGICLVSGEYAHRPGAATPVSCSAIPQDRVGIDCGDGTCLVKLRNPLHCDGILDCRTGADEDWVGMRSDRDCLYNWRVNCKLIKAEDLFTCKDGMCINKKYVGDGQWDCYDKSDEQ